MSSNNRKTINLKNVMKDAALDASPSFPDFARVYQKVEQKPRLIRRYAISASLIGAAAVMSFWIGIGWNNRTLSNEALIDSWSTDATPSAISIDAPNGQEDQIILASSRKDVVNFFVQDLWESSSSNGL